MSYLCVAFRNDLLNSLQITIVIVVRSRFSPGPESGQNAVGKIPESLLKDQTRRPSLDCRKTESSSTEPTRESCPVRSF